MLKKLTSYAGLALFSLSLSTYGQTPTHPDVTFKVMVGSSSENIELSGELKLDDTIVTAP
jgi:hypothetical protein